MEKNKKHTYKISTIIPVYNSEKYIEQVMTSVINQKLKPYEIIIVNDGSNDETLIECEKFSEIYNNIKIINIENNRGVSYARNIGIKQAKGEYIHFVDSDDEIELNMYQEIMDEIMDKNVDMVITGTKYNENGKITQYIPNRQFISTYTEMKSFVKDNCISGRRDIFNVVWNKLYKKEFILRNNIVFDEEINFGEDFLFNCKCMKRTNLIYVMDNAYYNYMRRKNIETLKMKFIENKIELRKKFYREWVELYKYYKVYDNVKDEMELYEGYKIYQAIISVTNSNCTLNFEEKLNYIKKFVTFENANCLFKYMENNKELYTELKCVRNSEIEKFLRMLIQKSNKE